MLSLYGTFKGVVHLKKKKNADNLLTPIQDVHVFFSFSQK